MEDYGHWKNYFKLSGHIIATLSRRFVTPSGGEKWGNPSQHGLKNSGLGSTTPVQLFNVSSTGTATLATTTTTTTTASTTPTTTTTAAAATTTTAATATTTPTTTTTAAATTTTATTATTTTPTTTTPTPYYSYYSYCSYCSCSCCCCCCTSTTTFYFLRSLSTDMFFELVLHVNLEEQRIVLHRFGREFTIINYQLYVYLEPLRWPLFGLRKKSGFCGFTPWQ